MGERVLIKNDKRLPYISTAILLKIPISISIPKEVYYNFLEAIGKTELDVSKTIRKLIYAEMKIKNNIELQKKLKPAVKLSKSIIYELSKCEDNDFSRKIEKQIIKYIKNNNE